MPRNGNGVYTLPSGNPVVTQTLITSQWANSTMADLAAAITQSLAKDGQTTPTANLPMGGYRHIGAADPVSRSDYATLGYIQDGKAVRLTGISGTNQIVATLPGGATALSLGMTLQLIPTMTNTGAVTININNVGFVPVLSEAGLDLGPGNLLAGSPYIMLYDGASFTVVAGNVGGVNQNSMSGSIRPTDGLYPLITVLNPTTVTVIGGTGRIVAPSSLDDSGVTVVTWPTQNVVIQNLATAWSTQLGVNSNGQIVQFAGAFNPAFARGNIMIGAVAHINGVVNGVSTRPAIYGDMTYAAYDIGALFANQVISGGKLQPNVINPLQMNVSAGVLFGLGFDANEIDAPNDVKFPDQLNVSFFPVTGASTVAALAQNVPVTFYDPSGAGVITPIPGAVTATVIHRLYYLSSGQYLFLYGQNLYADLSSALSQISVDSASTVYPAKLGSAALLGYIVAQKNTTNLNNAATARLISRGGTDFAIGSSGSISEAPINGSLYGRIDANWALATPLPNGPSSTNRFNRFLTNDVLRFTSGINDTPEGINNTGSNFEIRAYNDAGGLTGTAMTVDRSSRQVTFPNITNGFGFNSFTADGSWAYQIANTLGASNGGLWRDGDTSIRFVNNLFNAGVALKPDLVEITAANAHVVGDFRVTRNATDGAIFFGAAPNGEYIYKDGANLTFTNTLTPVAGFNIGIGTSALRWGTAFILGLDVLEGVTGRIQTTVQSGRTTLQCVVPDASSHTALEIIANPLIIPAVTTTSNGAIVTVGGGQTITGRKIFESPTTDGTGDARFTRLGSADSGAVFFGTDNSTFFFTPPGESFINCSAELVVNGVVRTGADIEFSLGTATQRWTQVFAAAGAINTSDAREKTELVALTPQELAAAKQLGTAIGTYKWLDAITKKGDAARKHVGVTAQGVIAIMQANGLDAMEYGFVCYDEWDARDKTSVTGEVTHYEAGNRYGVRYDELLAFIAAGFEARLAALENV